MAVLLLALGSIWAMGLFVALVLCRVAADGDREMRSRDLAAHHTHEFGLRA